MVFKKLFDISVYKTKNFQVNQDWEVPISGFFVITPKRKVRSIIDFTDKEVHELIDIICKVRKAMKNILDIKEVFIFQEERTKFNFHIWILPRYGWMDKFGESADILIPALNYAKRNMIDNKSLRKVKDSAQKIRKYLMK